MITLNTLARHAFLALFTLNTTLATASEAFAAEPSPPAALRAEVYSQTAAELFWNRPDAFGLRYEIRRDGTTLTTTDGVSFFDNALMSGTAYSYAAVAIDRDGQRSAPATVTLQTRGGATTSAGPPAPGGLRAEVYSRTAVELFWNRPDVFGRRYEVRRDGTKLTTTDGVSFFDSSLTPGTSYEYGVRAINRDGERSAASTLRVTTAGASGDDGPLTPGALVTPEIERIAVYSGTAAELFWQRPSPGSPVARVEVARDNIVLGTTNGTSFFDDSRSPGVDYGYTLVAITADGRRSDGGASEPGAGGDGLDVIRPDNAVRLLAAVFDTYRGEPWGDIVHALPGFSYTPNISINEEETVICDNGGTVTVRLFSVPAGRSSSQIGFDFAFDDCQDGDTLFDGQVDKFDGRWGGTYVRSSGITVTRPTGTIRYSGTVFDEPGARAFSTSGRVDFERSAADGTQYSLTGAISHFQHGYSPFVPFATVNLSGGFSVASDRSSGVTLHAETPDTLIRPLTQDPETGAFEPLPEDWTFAEGSLRISAPDASSVLLEANNGDDRSARLTVIDTSGERTSFDQQWGVWQGNLRFD